MTKHDELRHLWNRLADLVEILRLDPQSQWLRKFESDMERCGNLSSGQYSSDDIVVLSKSVTDVYRGTGSFNDYAPGTFDASSGRYSALPGAERFDEIARQVFDAAVALRV
jgi:hypothetical protein